MKLRQAVVPAGASVEVNDLLLKMEQLGIEICTFLNPAFNVSEDWSERLLLCDHGFISTNAGRAVVREVVANGGTILIGAKEGDHFIDTLKHNCGDSDELRQRLSNLALYRCLEKDAEILSRLQAESSVCPQYMVSTCEKVHDLRYGENWHQKAAIYKKDNCLGLHTAQKLNGKEMSYNNFVDAETVLEMLIDLSEYDGVPAGKPLATIVKHANPCGVAYGPSLKQAYRWANATDPKSAFGGVIGFNMPVDLATAKAIGDSFVEVLLAPGFDPGALSILMRNKPNRRILDIGDMLRQKGELYSGHASRSVFGGLLLQDYDTADIKEWRCVTKRAPTDEENRALRFAWKVTKYVKSNALVYTTTERTVGIGSGQVSRVDSARFGAEKAEEHGLDTRGTVAATDSFFPFRDGLDQVHEAGATAVVHPGGSIRDEEVIRAADEHEMAMVFTGMRHFRH